MTVSRTRLAWPAAAALACLLSSCAVGHPRSPDDEAGADGGAPAGAGSRDDSESDGGANGARQPAPTGRPLLEVDVVTFNIRYLNAKEEGRNHWDVRKPLVFEAIREFDADVLGLQEALRTQLDDIAEAVDGYTEFGVGRDDGRRRGEYSPILYRDSRFELDESDSGTFWLSDTPEQPGSMTWGNQIPRICTWARLTDRQTRRSFYVYNTHWDHKSQASRLGAARLIAQRVAARERRSEPVIVMGDFNASRSNEAIAYLTGDETPAPLVDSMLVHDPDFQEVRTFHGFRGGRGGHKIDHILVSTGTLVRDAEVLFFNRDGAYPSDHYPVRAVLQFR